MIKAIVFDISEILINETGKEARKIMAEKFNFSDEDFGEFFKKYSSYSYTGWHYNAFFQKMVEDMNLQISYESLVSEWLRIREETSSVNKDAEILTKKLKKNYVLGMVSNSTLLNEKTSARKYIKNLFDENLRILSCDIGFMKPDIKIYEILIFKLQEKGILPEESVFIDDTKENLLPAQKLGMKTILYKDVAQLKRELKNLGVKWG